MLHCLFKSITVYLVDGNLGLAGLDNEPVSVDSKETFYKEKCAIKI